MAEEESKTSLIISGDEADIPTTYANITDIAIGASDVSLFFGVELSSKDDQKVYKYNSRVSLTHDHFMRMMEYWLVRYEFLREVYEGRPKNIFDIAEADKDKFEFLVKKYINPGEPEEHNGKDQ